MLRMPGRDIPHLTLQLRSLCLLACLLVSGGCQAGEAATDPRAAATPTAASTVSSEESAMWMNIGEHRFAITLADNPAARALVAQLPLTLDMSELNGNEKHARLPKALPADASRPGAIHSGDLMLFGADTLVVFYSSFRSSYAYTRLGRMDDPTELAQALGRRDVRAVFSNLSPSDQEPTP